MRQLKYDRITRFFSVIVGYLLQILLFPRFLVLRIVQNVIVILVPKRDL